MTTTCQFGPMLTVAEVAEILRTSPYMVSDLIATGQLKAYALNGAGGKRSRYAISHEQFRDYLTQTETGKADVSHQPVPTRKPHAPRRRRDTLPSARAAIAAQQAAHHEAV